MRTLILLFLIIPILSLYGQSNILEDSVSCILLKKDKIDGSNLSRTQFVMSSDSLCIVRHIPYGKLDSIIHHLDYIGDLNYNTDQFALDWVVDSDSVISLESMTPPVVGLIIVYNINHHPSKFYSDKDINSLIWVTKETIEIGNKEFILSNELKDILFEF